MLVPGAAVGAVGEPVNAGEAIVALNAQDLSTTAGYLIQIAEYYAFLGLIMTAAQNSSIVPSRPAGP